MSTKPGQLHVATNTTPAPNVRPPAGRRRLLALAAGATALATTAHAAATTDGELEALWREHERLDAQFHEACNAESAASRTARGKHPPRPRILFGRQYETGALFELAIDDIVRWRDQAAAMRLPGAAIHERQFAAWHSWRAACDAVDVEHGLPELEARSTALLDEITALENKMAGIPARSMRDALAKLQLVNAIELYSELGTEDDLAGRVVLGLIRDLNVIAGGAQ